MASPQYVFSTSTLLVVSDFLLDCKYHHMNYICMAFLLCEFSYEMYRIWLYPPSSSEYEKNMRNTLEWYHLNEQNVILHDHAVASTVENHMRMHTGEKPYNSCTGCHQNSWDAGKIENSYENPHRRKAIQLSRIW